MLNNKVIKIIARSFCAILIGSCIVIILAQFLNIFPGAFVYRVHPVAPNDVEVIRVKTKDNETLRTWYLPVHENIPNAFEFFQRKSSKSGWVSLNKYPNP